MYTEEFQNFNSLIKAGGGGILFAGHYKYPCKLFSVPLTNQVKALENCWLFRHLLPSGTALKVCAKLKHQLHKNFLLKTVQESKARIPTIPHPSRMCERQGRLQDFSQGGGARFLVT